MDKIFEYLPEVITALWGLITGILLEKVNANKDKRMEIFQLRKDMYIEVYKKYYNDLLDYYDNHTSDLVLISNTKVSDLFTEYIKLMGTYIDNNEWNSINRDEALKVAQKLINKMRRKLLSSD